MRLKPSRNSVVMLTAVLSYRKVARDGDGGTALLRVRGKLGWGRADVKSSVVGALLGGVSELNYSFRVVDSASILEVGVGVGRLKRTWLAGSTLIMEGIIPVFGLKMKFTLPKITLV